MLDCQKFCIVFYFLSVFRDEFSQQLVKFVAKKADLLFAKGATCNFHWPTNSSNGLFVI